MAFFTFRYERGAGPIWHLVKSNRLLEALPSEVSKRLCPALVYLPFALGDVVYESGERMEHVYFPTSAVVSLIYTMENGDTAEMGLVGKEGVVGIALFLGGDTTPNQAVVQVAGSALRMSAGAMLEEFRRGGPFQLAMLRYSQALLTQVSQTAVCNRLHPIEQRLCRWLLMTRNRVSSDEVHMTQEFLAHMLGVRREGVTLAAHHLQDAGLIRYSRGTSPSWIATASRRQRASVTESSRTSSTGCSGHGHPAEDCSRSLSATWPACARRLAQGILAC